jgi:hypothetical protein
MLEERLYFKKRCLPHYNTNKANNRNFLKNVVFQVTENIEINKIEIYSYL